MFIIIIFIILFPVHWNNQVSSVAFSFRLWVDKGDSLLLGWKFWLVNWVLFKLGWDRKRNLNVWLIFCRLEERQRAEKRSRESKGHQFTPKWFDPTSEVTPTPWGDLEIYCYNGKYTEHRAAIDSSDGVKETDVSSKEFNPWQYEISSPEWSMPYTCYINRVQPLAIWNIGPWMMYATYMFA